MRTKNYGQIPDVPLPIIAHAVNYDPEAMQFVVNHFEGYIKTWATTHLRDDAGEEYSYVDEYVKRLLEIKLISSIPKFKIK